MNRDDERSEAVIDNMTATRDGQRMASPETLAEWDKQLAEQEAKFAREHTEHAGAHPAPGEQPPVLQPSSLAADALDSEYQRIMKSRFMKRLMAVYRGDVDFDELRMWIEYATIGNNRFVPLGPTEAAELLACPHCRKAGVRPVRGAPAIIPPDSRVVFTACPQDIFAPLTIGISAPEPDGLYIDDMRVGSMRQSMMRRDDGPTSRILVGESVMSGWHIPVRPFTDRKTAPLFRFDTVQISQACSLVIHNATSEPRIIEPYFLGMTLRFDSDVDYMDSESGVGAKKSARAALEAWLTANPHALDAYPSEYIAVDTRSGVVVAHHENNTEFIRLIDAVPVDSRPFIAVTHTKLK